MVDHLFHSQGYGDYRNGGGGTRQKAKESVVVGSPEWVVGLPKDIQFKGRRGGMMTLNLVSMITKVDPEWLVEVAPQLVNENRKLRPHYDERADCVCSETEVHFNGQLVQTVQNELDPENPQASEIFVSWLAQQMAI